MIEGLWVIRFILPVETDGDLNGGVVVIETGRLLGGDSGYFYVGDVSPLANGTWKTLLTITRHDPNIESMFGDIDEFKLEGIIKDNGSDDKGRLILRAIFPTASGFELGVELKKVAELP